MTGDGLSSRDPRQRREAVRSAVAAAADAGDVARITALCDDAVLGHEALHATSAVVKAGVLPIDLLLPWLAGRERGRPHWELLCSGWAGGGSPTAFWEDALSQALQQPGWDGYGAAVYVQWVGNADGVLRERIRAAVREWPRHARSATAGRLDSWFG